MELTVGDKIVSESCLDCSAIECALEVLSLEGENISLLSPSGEIFDMTLDDERLFGMVKLDKEGNPIFE